MVIELGVIHRDFNVDLVHHVQQVHDLLVSCFELLLYLAFFEFMRSNLLIVKLQFLFLWTIRSPQQKFSLTHPTHPPLFLRAIELPSLAQASSVDTINTKLFATKITKFLRDQSCLLRRNRASKVCHRNYFCHSFREPAYYSFPVELLLLGLRGRGLTFLFVHYTLGA